MKNVSVNAVKQQYTAYQSVIANYVFVRMIVGSAMLLLCVKKMTSG